SQINVHTLIASTLDLTPNLSNNNYQLFLQNGLFSGGPVPTGFNGSGTAVFAAGTSGAVTGQAGAVIDTTQELSATGDGGYVALIGANVTNAGTITTRNGQIILAADNGGVTLIAPPTGAVGVQTAMQVIAGGGQVTNDAPLVNVGNGSVIPVGGLL